MSAYVLVIIIAGCAKHIWSLQVVPERASLVYINDKYITDAKINVKRYSRRSNYYINLEGTIKHTWANNVSTHFIFYEYLHNEYKRSFVEMHFKLCDLINKDPYIGKAVANIGITCPILSSSARYYHRRAAPDFTEYIIALLLLFPFFTNAIIIVSGHQRLNNITIPTHDFPNVWPFERSKVDFKIKLVSSEELIGHAEIYVLFKQKV